MSRIYRWIPLLIIFLAFILAIYFRLYDYFNFKILAQYHKQLTQWTSQHYMLAVILYVLVYVVAVAASIPGATILTITGGFLFGYFFGTLYVVISASIGASIIFLAVKTALESWLQEKASRWVRRMEQGFQKNAFNYLLFLRLVPLFPFWVVNIVPALLGVRFRIFFLATFIGIIPGSFVYVSVGRGLESILAVGKTPNLKIIFEPHILLPLLALAILALIPPLYKKARRQETDD